MGLVAQSIRGQLDALSEPAHDRRGPKRWGLDKKLALIYSAVSVAAVGIVLLLACLVMLVAGDNVKSDSRKELLGQVETNLQISSKYTAEAIYRKLANLDGMVAILEEAVQDRFAGYTTMPNSNAYTDATKPYYEAYVSDNLAPFINAETGLRGYPWRVNRTVLEHEVDRLPKVTASTALEHVGNRLSWYAEASDVSTAGTIFYMQGQCKVGATADEELVYYEGCTPANNDLSTGGSVRPTANAGLLAERSSDLDVIMKPLYESHTDVKLIGIFFANDGAGAARIYPALLPIDFSPYESSGCDWLAELKDTAEWATVAAEMASNCHAEGETVVGREYNVLERGWCRDQGLSMGRTFFAGPYRDTWSDLQWIGSAGKAVFDRLTGDFIACVKADYSIQQLANILRGVQISDTATSNLVRWESSGTIVAGDAFDTSVDEDLVAIYDGVEEIDEDTWAEMRDTGNSWDTLWRRGSRIFARYPIPPPEELAEGDEPDFVVVLSVDEASLLDDFDDLDATVDSDVSRVIQLEVTIAACLLGVLIAIIVYNAQATIHPLKTLSRAAEKVTTNAAGDLAAGLDMKAADERPDEIGDLLREFYKLVIHLGGSDASRVSGMERGDPVPNAMDGKVLKKALWAGAAEAEMPNFKAKHQQASTQEKRQTILDVEKMIVAAKDAAAAHSEAIVKIEGNGILRSRLFLLLFISIGLPLIGVLVAVSVITALEVTSLLPSWVENVRTLSIDLEYASVESTVQLRSSYAAEVMFRPMRDLHLYSRAAGWLYFDAVQRTPDFFTSMTEINHECAARQPYTSGECPEATSLPCYCEWQDSKPNAECVPEDDFDPLTQGSMELPRERYEQREGWNIQADDAHPVTGNRSSSSYPATSYSAESVQYFDEPSALPGAAAGGNASGFATAYARVRVGSALAAVTMPLYNYYTDEDKDKYWGTFIGFEADGGRIGFMGCDYSLMADGAAFQSSDANEGFLWGGDEICPEGKFGYDARCRPWYSKGKDAENSLYVMPPYSFVGTGAIACTASFAVREPTTGDYLGQAGIDFLPGEVGRVLRESTPIGRTGFNILVTPEVVNGNDAVVAPGLDATSKGAIMDFVLPNDPQMGTNREYFDSRVLVKMKAGETGTERFFRRDADGIEEEFFVAYTGVSVDAIEPVSHMSYANGTSASPFFVYGLASVIPVDELDLPFRAVEDRIEAQIRAAIIVFIVFAVAAVLTVFGVTLGIAARVLSPIFDLLYLVQRMNADLLEDGFEPVVEGPKEVVKISQSFAKLYTVVQFTNINNFSDPKSMYSVLAHSLKLFRTLRNPKAVGVATNNMGNVAAMISKQRAKAEGPSGEAKVQDAGDAEAKLGDAGAAASTAASAWEAEAELAFNESVAIARNSLDNVMGARTCRTFYANATPLDLGERKHLMIGAGGHAEAFILTETDSSAGTEAFSDRVSSFLNIGTPAKAPASRDAVPEVSRVGGLLDIAEQQRIVGYKLLKASRFAQQLANRLISRAMYRVGVLCPRTKKDTFLAMADLMEAQALDDDVKKLVPGASYFDHYLRRAASIAAIEEAIGDGQPMPGYSAEVYLERAAMELVMASREDEKKSPLLREKPFYVLKQQLDVTIANMQSRRGNAIGAARTCARMLIEDAVLDSKQGKLAIAHVTKYLQSVLEDTRAKNGASKSEREKRKTALEMLVAVDQEMFTTKTKKQTKPISVMFCLDYSGSMNLHNRITLARDNMLKIFDEFISDRDLCGFIRFNHKIDDKLRLPLRRKGDFGRRQRKIMERANVAVGGTQFMCALVKCIDELEAKGEEDKYIIALTDGETSDEELMDGVRDRLKTMDIRLILIGLALADHAESFYTDMMKELPNSVYINAADGAAAVEEAFSKAAKILQHDDAIMMETL